MRSRSVVLSVLAHAAALLAVVIVPLFATADLPHVQNPMPPFMAAYHAGALPAAPPATRVASPGKRLPNPDAAPVHVPTGITAEPALTTAARGPVVPGGLESDATPGLPTDFDTGTIDLSPPPSPVPGPVAPVPVGGNIRAPRRLAYVPPIYPAVAQNAGVQGLVILEATIDVDGRVQNVRVLRSYPFLERAALDAVRQWRYTPTLLNGVPVPIIMTVTVDFRLSR